MLPSIAPKYSVLINLKFGELTGLINWCQLACGKKWDYRIVDMAGSLPGEYEFNFTDKTDYINFILWKK